MAAEPDYTNSSQQCLIACVEVLSRSLLTPLTVADAAEALADAYTPDQVRRALWNLEKGGWAVKAGGGYLLSPDLTRFSDRLRLQLIEFGRKYLGESNA